MYQNHELWEYALSHYSREYSAVHRLAEEPLFVDLVKDLQTQYNLAPTENLGKFVAGYKVEHETRFNVKNLETETCN